MCRRVSDMSCDMSQLREGYNTRAQETGVLLNGLLEQVCEGLVNGGTIDVANTRDNHSIHCNRCSCVF